jgi:undecaprenyl-diphosphatase
MSDYLLAIILGVVEGLTEFLPVSSTAHIQLTLAAIRGESALNDGFWKMFAVAIQFPAILAVVVYFRTRLIEFVKSFFEGGVTIQKCYTHPLGLVAIACVCTVVGVLGVPRVLAAVMGTEKELIKQNLSSLKVMGWALVIGAIVMWVVDALAKNPKIDSLEKMKPWHAAWIGALQTIAAIFPGTSRSMTTTAAGQLVGMSRTSALEFSFFVSIPIMAMACTKDLLSSLKAGPDEPLVYVGEMTGARWVQLGLGGVVSFFVAWVVIAWFMGWVRKRGFAPFAIYRLIIGVVVLAWAYKYINLGGWFATN